jgi:hypothetical protein
VVKANGNGTQLKKTKARLHKPGFTLLIVLIAALCVARDLKPTRVFDVKLPEFGEFSSFGLAYVRNGQLALWYAEHGEGKLSKRGEVRESDPWQLRIKVFDTTSGQERQSLRFPTRRLSSDIVASNGRVMIVTGPLVRCHSEDLKQIGQVPLGEPQRGHDFEFLAPSPGGKAVWVVESAETILLKRIDTERCKLTTKVEIPQGLSSLTASDDALLATSRMRLSAWSPQKGYTTLYEAQTCCLKNARFVSQSLIMAYHDDEKDERKIVIVNSEGKLLLEDHVKKEYGIGPILTSAGGGVAAAVTPDNPQSGFYGTGFGASKIQVAVYDLARIKRLATLEAPFSEGVVRVALSPDGREAAILSGNKISVYDLPR